MKDIKNNIDAVTSIKSAAHTATVNGAGADLRGFDAAMVFISVGTITDGTHTPKVEESDDNSSWSDVAATDLQGTLAALATDTDQRVGYIGNKRYIRVTATISGATTGGVYTSSVMRGIPHRAPVS